MKPVVQINKQEQLNNTEVELVLNGQAHSRFIVGKRISFVETALLLLGANSVKYTRESGTSEHHSPTNMLGTILEVAQVSRPLGNIELVERWSEPLEEVRLDLFVDGVRRESVNSRRDVVTLKGILVQLGFTIDHGEPIRLAA
ncbi:hypothetical protein KTD31_01735 [Burkholderia multivorans]|jgi:hypothetical protein|uniref:hypothetical protein n=1 Tax=Burkholderia multivorans TaxID=87883 RepID=UPI001C23F854|nr:hypothetical protein [Burkholderia multivorans]MBU9200124.1 hypothetical protein [Burkholderia multivorans]MDN8078754.1 hypothetical protein [Burkholderia multivorans]